MHHRTALKKHLLLFCAIAISLIWSFSSLKPQSISAEPTLNVWMLNVGQGESILTQEPSGKKLLFDGGPNESVLSELGAILPIWDRTIDLVIVSHNHSDHIRGLIPVLERYRVKEVWLSGAIHTSNDYQTFLAKVKERNLTPKITFFDPKACTGSICPIQIPFGMSYLQIYHPLKDQTGVRPKDQHDATIVVKVTFGNSSILLSGDIDEGHEQDIMAACPIQTCTLKSTILQIPHHGSASGLSPEFLLTVQPQAALIPVGQTNKFHHPNPFILEKLNVAHIPTYRTDTQGRIHAQLTNTAFSITTEK